MRVLLSGLAAPMLVLDVTAAGSALWERVESRWFQT